VAAPVINGAEIVDLVQRRLERALRARARYRYVQPRVTHEGEAFRIQSPCCSRNVDPSGGLIDIALLVPQEGGRWRLCTRNHVRKSWVSHLEGESLASLLHVLCVDSERQFWL
jgi:hypothetical protein